SGRDERRLERGRGAVVGGSDARARARARSDARGRRGARLSRHTERAASAFARRAPRSGARVFRACDRAFGRARSFHQGRICTPLCAARLRPGAARPIAGRSARGSRRGAGVDAVQRAREGGRRAASCILEGILLMTESHVLRRVLKLAALLVGARGVVSPAAGGELKIATSAPDGSHWMREMRAAAAEIKERTGGGVEIKFYPGGVMGNDAQVLRKIRIGQLHG